MSRALHTCITCPPEDKRGKFPGRRGLTRHKPRVCSWCRCEGVTTGWEAEGNRTVVVPLEINLRGRGA